MDMLTIFRRPSAEIEVTEDDLRPMSELDHFTVKTRAMLSGLDQKIDELDTNISLMIQQLNDLRKIRTAQQLALNFMEDK